MKRTTLTIIASLLLGGVIGFLIAGRLTERRLHKLHERNHAPVFRQHIAHKLELNEIQMPQFDSLFTDHMMRMKDINGEMHEHKKKEFERFFNEIKTILDENQAQKLDNIKRRMHKKRKRRQHRPPHME